MNLFSRMKRYEIWYIDRRTVRYARKVIEAESVEEAFELFASSGCDGTIKDVKENGVLIYQN